MSALFSITSFPRFLAFSAGRRRESASSTSRLLPPLRWNRCLGLARSVRVEFLGSAKERPAVVRFVPRAGLTAGAEDLLHDAGATVVILVGGYALVFGFNDLTRRGVIQQDRFDLMSESEQKTGSYALWIALSSFLANFQGIAEGSPVLCFDADVVFSYFLARFPSWGSLLGNDVWRRW